MGWSCTRDAGLVLDAWQEFCAAQTGTSNTYRDARGQEYFFETGREQVDGAITGTIWRSIDEGRCRRSGTFRIEPDGTIARAPVVLKRAAVQYAKEGR